MFRTLVALIVLFLALAGAASAQQDRSSQIDNARTTFAEIRTQIESGEFDDPEEIEAQLRQLRDDSRNRLGAVDRELAGVNAQLAAIGNPPGENDPPESPELAAERSALNAEFSRLNSQKTRINANIIEANDLLARISTSRFQSLYQKLGTRGASPLAPAVWGSALTSAGEISTKISRYFERWSAGRSQSGELWQAVFFIALALLAAIIIFGPVNRWVMRTFSAAIEKHEPTPARRVLVAGLKMLARAIPGLIGGFIVIETLRAQGVLTDQGEAPVRALWFGLVIYLLVSGFLSGLFAPANPAWRIAPVEAGRARTISFLINSIVILFSLKILLAAIFTAVDAAPELTRLLEAIVAIAVSCFLFLLCRKQLWGAGKSLGFVRGDSAETSGGEVKASPQGWRIIRRSARAVAIATPIAALAGYVELANFIVSRVYYFAIILAFAWFIRAALLELAQYLWRRRDDEELEPEEVERRLSNVRFWNGWLINVLLVIAVAPAVFILAGTPTAAVRDGVRQALFGFNLGGVQIPSLAKISFAILIFAGIMTLTRIAQRGFREGPFAHSNIDSGVQNSLITLVGYAGLLVALFASISSIGFDLSNLALIAGALSVGIGFGLQSIVNNFVSGLILLFERPIKVGDWVVTTSGEGTVKKISVRSTEIETFDRSSIIVPNSELISSTVTNWTHRNKIGRIIVPVGVAYGSDVDRVKEILLKCAEENPLIVRYPEPFVVWQNFGDSSLDFELRGFLADITRGLQARSELRFAINKAFAEAGIEIPFPQRDLHVKSWPADLTPDIGRDREITS